MNRPPRKIPSNELLKITVKLLICMLCVIAVCLFVSLLSAHLGVLIAIALLTGAIVFLQYFLCGLH